MKTPETQPPVEMHKNPVESVESESKPTGFLNQLSLRELSKSALRFVESSFGQQEDYHHDSAIQSELKDRHLFTGEATEYKRAAWLLGRKFIGNARPIVATKPLGVKLPGYMTEHLANICLSTQRPLLAIGSVGFHEDRDFDFKNEDLFHMSWMASDIFSIIEQAETRFNEAWQMTGRKLSLQDFDIIGVSQGAMVGLDVIAQAKWHDCEVKKGVFAGPAGLLPARKPGRNEAKNLLKMAKQFGFDEPLGFARHFIESPPAERVRMLTRFAPTLKVPLRAVKPVTMTAYQILDAPMQGIGEALRSQNNNTEISILLYEEDAASSPNDWFYELRPDLAPQIAITKTQGRHLAGIVSRETDQYFIDNLTPEAKESLAS